MWLTPQKIKIDAKSAENALKNYILRGGGKPKRIIDLLLLLVCQTGGRMWHGPLYYLEFSAKFGNI